jgi:hypothetical protein
MPRAAFAGFTSTLMLLRLRLITRGWLELSAASAASSACELGKRRRQRRAVAAAVGRKRSDSAVMGAPNMT